MEAQRRAAEQRAGDRAEPADRMGSADAARAHRGGWRPKTNAWLQLLAAEDAHPGAEDARQRQRHRGSGQADSDDGRPRR